MPFSLDIMQWAVPAQLLQLTPELQRMLQVHSFVSFYLILFILSFYSFAYSLETVHEYLL